MKCLGSTVAGLRARCGATISVLSLALLAACGGGGSQEPAASAMGSLRLALTDAPACGYDAVYVSVQKLRVHQSGSGADGDAGWSEIVLSPARRVDLLTLSNGVLEELGQTRLPAGHYTQLRLVLATNEGSAPLANAVQPSGGTLTALTTPSGAQTGIKLNVDMEVEAGKVADFVLDFDACRSVVRRGSSGHFNLNPVLQVLPRISAAGLRVSGHVDPLMTGVQVSVQQAGKPVKSTLPDSSGRFVLYPVPVGNYELVVSGGGRVTAVMTGVPVTETAATQINPAALPITLPAATLRTVEGSLSPAAATLRMLQSLTGGPTVEVAWTPVDGASGGFSQSLAKEAPLRMPYAANLTALNFSADAPVAGRYTVEANSAGVLKTQSIDVTNPVPSLVFGFP